MHGDRDRDIQTKVDLELEKILATQMIQRFRECLIAFVFLPLFFCPVASVADGNYDDHSQSWAVGLVLEQPGFLFRIANDEDATKKIDYRPNLKATTGVMLSGFGYSATYLGRNNQKEGDITSRGETNYDDLRLSTFLGDQKQWRVNGYYTRYKGFYIDNSNYVDSSVGPNDPKVQRSDLKFINYGVSIMHVIDPQSFSVSAATDFAHQQTQSGGSWLVNFDFDHSQFEAQNAVVQSSVSTDFGSDSDITRGDFNTVSVLAGYGYAFVFNNFFLTPMAQIGLGLQQRKYTVDTIEQSSWKITRKIAFSASAGFNGETFFSGVQFGFHQLQFETSTLHLSTQLEVVRVTVGARF